MNVKERYNFTIPGFILSHGKHGHNHSHFWDNLCLSSNIAVILIEYFDYTRVG